MNKDNNYINRRQYLKLSRAELSMLVNKAIEAKNAPLAEALQDVYTFKRDRNREARRKFGV
jgi:hypothetical protein